MATACARNQYRNRYYHRARLSERKFRELVRCFAVDLNASDTARLSGISVRTVNTLFLKLRRRLAAHAEGCSVFNELPENAGCGILDRPLPQAGSRAADRAPLLFGLHRQDPARPPGTADPPCHESGRHRPPGTATRPGRPGGGINRPPKHFRPNQPKAKGDRFIWHAK